MCRQSYSYSVVKVKLVLAFRHSIHAFLFSTVKKNIILSTCLCKDNLLIKLTPYTPYTLPLKLIKAKVDSYNNFIFYKTFVPKVFFLFKSLYK